MRKSEYSEWIKRHIVNNDFCTLNADYTTLQGKRRSGNNPNATVTEHYLTIDFAKKLAMKSSSEKGEQVRQYFIECERQLKSRSLPFDPDDPISILDYAKGIAIENKALKEANLVLENKVHLLTHIKKTFTTTEVAKELGFKSAIALNKKLVDMKIQFKQNGTWLLYSQFSELGYTSIKEEVLDCGRIVYTRHWTNEGRTFLLELFSDDKEIKE